MKTPHLKLKNLKETRIPCPSFRRVYTFFTYSPRNIPAPANTLSLQKNTFPTQIPGGAPSASSALSGCHRAPNLQLHRHHTQTLPSLIKFVLIRGFPQPSSSLFFPPCKYLNSRGVAKFPAHPRKISPPPQKQSLYKKRPAEHSTSSLSKSPSCQSIKPTQKKLLGQKPRPTGRRPPSSRPHSSSGQPLIRSKHPVKNSSESVALNSFDSERLDA
jgi:hypothetical protein